MRTRENLVTGLFPRERRYFEAAGDGRLMIQECDECARLHGPFDYVCPCGSAALTARTAQGTGTVRALTQVHRAQLADLTDRVPYWVAVVELDEGPSLVATLARGATDPRIDDRVTAEFIPCADSIAVPEFRRMEKS